MVVVFDMDDTLFREVDFVASGQQAVRAQLYPELSLEQVARIPWGDTEKDVYRRHLPTICLTDDARHALDMLKANGVGMALITDGRVVTQTNKYCALGLDAYIAPDRVFISGAVGHDKRERHSFDSVMRLFPDEREFVYVGDNPAKDFIWPNRLGWTSVMLTDAGGTNVHSQCLVDLPEEQRPTLIINSLADFVAALLT